MGYYRALTLDHTQAGSSDTANYPLFFTGHASLATVANGGRVTSSSGYDIVFCTNPASPLSTLLNFERVSWSASTGLGEFWIQIPTLSHTVDTVVYVYYGDAAITTDQQNRGGTWNSNFKGVWHFGDGVTLDLTDSTSNANNGTNHSVTAASGLLGGAGSFDGSTSFVDLGNDASIEIAGSLTLEAWVSVTGSPSFPRIISNLMPISGFSGFDLLLNPGSYYYCQTWGPGGPALSQSTTVPTPAYLAVTYNGTDLTIYLNGAAQLPYVLSGAIGVSSQNLNIGRWPGAASNFWDGLIDEARISNAPQSADQILANYNNTKTGSTFIVIGTEANAGGSVVGAKGLAQCSGSITAAIAFGSQGQGMVRCFASALAVVDALASAQGIVRCSGGIEGLTIYAPAKGIVQCQGFATSPLKGSSTACLEPSSSPVLPVEGNAVY